MIEVAGNIANVATSILIDSGVSHSYIAPNIVYRCYMKKSKLELTSLVQTATATKRKVIKVVKKCALDINGVNTFVDMNIIPLGSYDMLIGLDSLDSHHAILDYHNKTYPCLYEEGNQVLVRGILRLVSLRWVMNIQLKKCFRKVICCM